MFPGIRQPSLITPASTVHTSSPVEEHVSVSGAPWQSSESSAGRRQRSMSTRSWHRFSPRLRSFQGHLVTHAHRLCHSDLTRTAPPGTADADCPSTTPPPSLPPHTVAPPPSPTQRIYRRARRPSSAAPDPLVAADSTSRTRAETNRSFGTASGVCWACFGPSKASV